MMQYWLLFYVNIILYRAQKNFDKILNTIDFQMFAILLMPFHFWY